MSDRQHVWHDPSYPPNRVITQDPARLPKPGKSAKRVFWVVLGVAFVLGLCTFVALFGSALIAGVVEGISDPMMPVAFSADEEEAVRGLAAAIADRGKRGDFDAIVAMGASSEHLDEAELTADVSEAFTSFHIKDWAIDMENAQVLVDQESEERILVFRIVLTGPDDTTRVTNPFYAVEADSTWRLTGIGGRDVIEDVY